MFEPIKLKKESRPATRRLDLEKTLCEAIKEQKVVRLRYKNEFHSRTFEPYIIYNSSTDKILVGGTQTKDDSEPLKPAKKRYFEIGLVNSLSVTDNTFNPDTKFSSFGKEYSSLYVFCAIDRL